LLAKIVAGVDDELDALADGLSDPLDLRAFVDPKLSGRGLLHWVSWFDPWLMGCDLCPDHWPLGVDGREISDNIWELDLSTDWSPIQRAITANHQYQEQMWLPWQLRQAYAAYEQCNDSAVLYYGRAIVGSCISDASSPGG